MIINKTSKIQILKSINVKRITTVVLFIFLLMMTVNILSGCEKGIEKNNSTYVSPTSQLKNTQELNGENLNNIDNIQVSEKSSSTPFSITTPFLQLSPTPFPIQKLTSDQKIEFMDFTNETSTCRLPCWNDVTPGISSPNTIQGFFARLGIDYILNQSLVDSEEGSYVANLHDYLLGVTDESIDGSMLEIEISWQDNVINEIVINNWDYPEVFTINHIAEKLGKPDKIYIEELQYGFYTVILHYSSKNTIIEFNGQTSSFDPKLDLPHQVCLNQTKSQWINARFYSNDYFPQILEGYLYYPWKEWSVLLGISEKELWNELQKPSACLGYP